MGAVNGVAPDRAAIAEAAERIRPFVRRTPTVVWVDGVELKLECLQVTGSFKARGMFNRLLTADGAAGVVAASGGNAGLAVAHAAMTLGLDAVIFVPEAAPAVKVARIEGTGATVRRVGATYADALEASADHAARTGALVVHAYDQPEVVAGAGTIAAELPAVDTVLVAVGGGGLIAGVASWFEGAVRVVAVESAGCPTLAEATKAGHPVDITPRGVAADSLGARRIGAIAWERWTKGHIHDTVLVPDESIAEARSALWRGMRVAAEPGGVTALAALRSGAYTPVPGERIAVIVCGANASPHDLTD